MTHLLKDYHPAGCALSRNVINPIFALEWARKNGDIELLEVVIGIGQRIKILAKHRVCESFITACDEGLCR